MEIVATGDVHEGMNFGYNVDPETGISERAMDLHRNFARAAKYAIEKGAGLFAVLGDLFDRTHVSPAFRELVRADVIEPLRDARIPVWILAGNHDQPRSMARGTSIEDFRGYPSVTVFRKPDVRILELGSARVGFLVLPYLHPEQIVEWVKEKLNEDIPKEQSYELSRRLWKEWMRKRAEEMDADYKILFGHYYVEGARISSTTYVEILPDEFSFTQDMIPQAVDLALFSHIHLHQVMENTPPIVYTGAPERIDWGERMDAKGFVSVNPEERTWRFIDLPVRDMVDVEVDVADSDDPTRDILNSLPTDVSGKMLRMRISVGEGTRERIDENTIADFLRPAFTYQIRWTEEGVEKVSLSEFTLDPYRLFKDFVDLNYSDHKKHDPILGEGDQILREVLS
ncbi:MAG: metallophosphoesterase [Candidatus Thermoplasmatota archaeon]|nr:metallophosphoesterase [Candidatus Thermoplasmatota archaeon]